MSWKLSRPVLRGLRHEVAYVLVVPEYSGHNPVFCHWYSTEMCGWSNQAVQSSQDNEALPNKVTTEPRGEVVTASVRAVGS